MDSPDAGSSAHNADILQRVIEALRDLDSDGRARILQTVAIFFDVGPVGGQQSTTTRSKGLPSEEMPRPSFSEDRSMSPKDFLLDKQARTDVERVACLAYYLTHYR